MIQDRIKQMRDYFGLTQAQLADSINKTLGYISLVETGRYKISEDAIKRICDIYSVNESWLLSSEGEMTSATPVDKGNIKKRIRFIRKEKNLTLDKFSSAIGYSKQLLSFIENGKTQPSDELIHKVASTYGVNIEWLMTGKGEIYAESTEYVDEKLIDWLNSHPEVIRELRRRSGLK